MLHIILSHHGKLEHGSPVMPCTREATLVHMIDNLGGTLGSFDRIEKSLGARRVLVGLRPRHLVVGLFRPPRRRRLAAANRGQATLTLDPYGSTEEASSFQPPMPEAWECAGR